MAGTPLIRARRGGAALRFDTVSVNQGGCCSRREPDLRAVFQRVAALGGWGDNAGGDEPVEPAGHVWTVRCRGNKLRDSPPMGSDYDPLPRLDSPNVSAEIVLEFAYASLHAQIIATCSHGMAQSPQCCPPYCGSIVCIISTIGLFDGPAAERPIPEEEKGANE